MKLKISKLQPQFLLWFMSILFVGVILSWITFANVQLTLLNAIIFAVFSLIFLMGQAKIHRHKHLKLMMLDFIDQFIIALSVHKTLLATLQSVVELSDERIKNEINAIGEVDPLQKLEYLETLFKDNIYQAFLTNIKAHNEQGGDVLQATSVLLKEVAEERGLIIKNQQLINQKLIELLTGWFFVFLIILMLRFAVTDIYQNLLKNNIFVYGLQAFIFLILISLIIFNYVALMVYLPKKASKTKKNTYISTNSFVELFTLFRISLSGGTNVYKTLEHVATLSEGPISQALLTLLANIKSNGNVSPFIEFSRRFNEPLVKHMLINMYQMMVNGGDVNILYEFNYLFDRLYEVNAHKNYRQSQRSFENITQLPMLGAGLLVILIMVGVIGLLGTMLYV